MYLSWSLTMARWITGLFDKLSGLFQSGIRSSPMMRSNYMAEWINEAPASDAGPVILYLPGGAFLMRTPNMHRSLVDRLTVAAGASSLLVFYRLAPEHPFPACLEDAVDAYRYLLDSGVEPNQIVVVGDSAGGCLTLSTLLKLRDEELPMPAGGIVMSPVTDFTHSGESRTRNAKSDPVLSTNPRIDQNALFLVDTPPDDPLASPAFADFSGLPPIMALVSDSEMLLDDTLAVQRKAEQASVPFDLHIGRDLPHVWPLFKQLQESSDSIRQMASFIIRITSARAGD